MLLDHINLHFTYILFPSISLSFLSITSERERHVQADGVSINRRTMFGYFFFFLLRNAFEMLKNWFERTAEPDNVAKRTKNRFFILFLICRVLIASNKCFCWRLSMKKDFVTFLPHKVPLFFYHDNRRRRKTILSFLCSAFAFLYSSNICGATLLHRFSVMIRRES